MSSHCDLHIAEVLADLSDLNLSDAQAARALVSTHTSFDMIDSQRRPSSLLSRSQSGTTMKSIERMSSSGSKSATNPPTPSVRRDVSSAFATGSEDKITDPDLDRATQLMDLYGLKSRIDEKGNEMQELRSTRNIVGQISLRAEQWARDLEQDTARSEEISRIWDEREQKRRVALREANENAAREREERLLDGEH